MARPRVGLLGIVCERTGPEAAAHRSHFVDHVGRRLASRVDVVLADTPCQCDQVRDAVRTMVERRVCGIACLMLTGGPTALPASGLAEARLPLLVANVQPERTVSEDWTAEDLIFNQGVRGAQELAQSLVRAGAPFTATTGDWMSDRFAGAVADWALGAQRSTSGVPTRSTHSPAPGAGTPAPGAGTPGTPGTPVPSGTSETGHEMLVRAAATLPTDAVVCHMQAMDWNRNAVLVARVAGPSCTGSLPAPGPTTTAAVATSDDRTRRLVVGCGEILREGATPRIGSPPRYFAPAAGIDRFLDAWLSLGASAEFLATPGDRREHWRSVAELLDTEYEEIR